MTDLESATEDAKIRQTVELLGGTRVVGREIRSSLDAHDVIAEGFPDIVIRFLFMVVHSSVHETPHNRLEKAFGMSMRTYQRRKENPRKLSAEQSGRAWKFAEILGRAIALFGSREEAEEWLERPAIALEQRKPIDLLSTTAGVEVLQNHLTRLEYGVYT